MLEQLPVVLVVSLVFLSTSLSLSSNALSISHLLEHLPLICLNLSRSLICFNVSLSPAFSLSFVPQLPVVLFLLSIFLPCYVVPHHSTSSFLPVSLSSVCRPHPASLTYFSILRPSPPVSLSFVNQAVWFYQLLSLPLSLPLFSSLSNLLTRGVVLCSVLWSWWAGCMVNRAAVRR